MAVNGRYLLEKRKKAEDACFLIERKIAEDSRTLQLAKFDQLSELKTHDKMIKMRSKELKDGVAQQLDRRRQCLADLYSNEMESWKSEVMSNVETQEDRKARMIERAYALRDARENERRKIVEEKTQQQWRNACDDVRVLDSKALTHYMSKERVQQIHEKISRKQKINSEENAIMVEWNRQQDHAKVIEDEKIAVANKKENDSRLKLQDQIQDNLLRKDKEYQRLQLEADEELSSLREQKDLESDRIKRRQEDARSRGREIHEYNQQLKILEAEEQQLQKHHDKILLDYALAKEMESSQDNNSKKQLLRQQAAEYAEYLKERASNQAEYSAYVDDVHRIEQEKVWRARDDDLQQRQDARDYLMRMVDDGRRDQIRSRQDQAMKEKSDNDNFGRKFVMDAKNGVEREREEAAHRRNIHLENNGKLQDQITFRRHKEDLEKQDIYLEEKRMQYAEREHQQKLRLQGGEIRTNFPLKGGQWSG